MLSKETLLSSVSERVREYQDALEALRTARDRHFDHEDIEFLEGQLDQARRAMEVAHLDHMMKA